MGLINGYTMGGAVPILPVIAVVVILIRVFRVEDGYNFLDPFRRLKISGKEVVGWFGKI